MLACLFADPETGQPIRSLPWKKAPTYEKTIVNKISGSAGPGELIAVLGARWACLPLRCAMFPIRNPTFVRIVRSNSVNVYL